MLKRNFVLCLAVGMFAAFGAVGCGGTSSNNTKPNTTADAGADTSADTTPDTTADAGTDTTPDATADTSDTTSNGGADAGDTTTTDAGDTAGDTNVPPPQPTCASTPKPARCTKDPTTFTWGPASVFNTLTINTSSTCCFDLTGDGNDNNTLGGLIGNQSSSINTSIQKSITDGKLLILFEHDGLTSLSTGGDYAINVYLADFDGITSLDPTGGNKLKIKAESIDQGTYPKTRMSNAKLSGTALTAGPGVLTLSISLFGAPLQLPIYDAMIAATVDTANSGIPDKGVALKDGKLGGAVRVKDIFDDINTFAKSCTCLGSPAKLIDYSSGVMNATCKTVDTSSCAATGTDKACSTIGGNCNIITSAGLLADVDTTGDGNADAISMAANFTAVGAKITGIAAATTP